MAAIAAGTVASVASLLALIQHSRQTRDTPWQLVNAPSHWVHGQAALRQRQVSVRYTLVGTAIHHASSLMWAMVYARLCDDRTDCRRPSLGLAALVAAGAWVVDTWVVPRRLTPGFERQATWGGLLAVYGSFGAGLWLGHQGLTRLSRTDATSTS